MIKTNDVNQLLVNEIINNNIKDSGYNNRNGRYYVEIRNVIFEADKNYIFENINKLDKFDDNWYIKHYESRFASQYQFLINKILFNPFTRQAILILPNYNDIEKNNQYPCTIFIHIFLNTFKDGFEVEYIVHMRSSDVIDYQTDLIWNNKIYNKIIKDLEKQTNWKLYRKNIIFNVDSIQVYKNYFNKILSYEENRSK